MNDVLLRIADSPPTSVTSGATVREAVAAMLAARVGAVAVIDDGALVGIFTERDLMRDVVGQGRDPATTRVHQVMVRDPVSVAPDTRRSVALDLMLERHFRHLPITGHDGRPVGMLSIRNLLAHQVGRLREAMDSLEQYIAADGPGG
jgi:CBS domain-containing protein